MWEERFASSPEFVFGKTPAQFLLDHDDYLTPGHTALSVADGEGRNSVHLAERGLNVTALEFAPTAIARARDLATERGVQVDFRQLDIMAQPWPTQQFDLVAGIFIQFVGPDGRRTQFRHIKDATKPGGLVMLHGYRPKQLDYGTGGPPFAENMYTETILRAAFAGWDILVLREYDREVQEGRGHSGMSALIDLIARKPG
ncbi:SAM-dependent methyltransferase [Thiosulfatihalobacter marinus]|jgi:SAM-dependent methyltransferase|uniref:SAM-dependent methyltransferase n=1 Tax=Thiosulfatihalobacter marinus TaxID=2792481 RepID=UPI0018D96F38|nr:class I SAM-dependent methyltransferase [Thiosulfatihalobacter marinus]